VVEAMDALHDRFPDRFAPAAVLVDHARGQQRFYPAQGRPVD
jgi:hypothetical protein